MSGSGDITVKFHVVISPSYSFKPSEDKLLVRFKSGTDHQLSEFKRLRADYFLFQGEVKLPVAKLCSRNGKKEEYKYCITGASRVKTGVLEYIGKKTDSTKAELFRELPVVREFCKDGVWEQYDGVIYPTSEKGFFKKKGPPKDYEEKLLSDNKFAMQSMLPTWEGLYCGDDGTRGLACHAVASVDRVVKCLLPNFMSAKPGGANVLKQTLLEWLQPKISELKESSRQRTDVRVPSALAVTYLIYKHKLQIQPHHAACLFEALCIQPNFNNERCMELDDVEKHFPENVSELINSLVDLCNRSMKKDSFQMKWLLAVPLLHFMKKQSKPFVPVLTQVDVTNLDCWLGVQGLEHRSCRAVFKDKQQISLIERLAPLFIVDHLLPRTIASVLSLHHLKDLVHVLPIDVYCAALHREIVTARKNIVDDRESLIETMDALAGCIKSSNSEAVLKVSCEICLSMVAHLSDVISISSYTVIISSVKLFFDCLAAYRSVMRMSVETSESERENIPENRSVDDFMSCILKWLKKILPERIVISTRIFGTDIMTSRLEMELWCSLLSLEILEQNSLRMWRGCLLDFLADRISKLKTMNVIDLCFLKSGQITNKLVEEVILNAAFRAFSNLLTSCNSTSDLKRCVTMINLLFTKYWSNINGMEDEEIVNHLLMWTPWCHFLNLFYTKRTCNLNLWNGLHIAKPLAVFIRASSGLLQGHFSSRMLQSILDHGEVFLQTFQIIDMYRDQGSLPPEMCHETMTRVIQFYYDHPISASSSVITRWQNPDLANKFAQAVVVSYMTSLYQFSGSAEPTKHDDFQENKQYPAGVTPSTPTLYKTEKVFHQETTGNTVLVTSTGKRKSGTLEIEDQQTVSKTKKVSDLRETTTKPSSESGVLPKVSQTDRVSEAVSKSHAEMNDGEDSKNKHLGLNNNVKDKDNCILPNGNAVKESSPKNDGSVDAAGELPDASTDDEEVENGEKCDERNPSNEKKKEEK